MIFVTGGTGLVGCNLLLKLVQSDEKIKALKRSTSNLETVQRFFKHHNSEHLFSKIEWIEGDLLDVTFLPKALDGISTIFHTAATVSFDKKREDEILENNISGTEALVNEAICSGVKEFIFVSSIAVFDDVNPLTKKLDEESTFNPDRKHSAYALSKFKSEMEVWRGSQEGLDVIVVNPSIIIGSLDGKRASERIFKNHFTNRYAPSGGTGFVDVRDVVAILLELREKKIYNQKFILNSENALYKIILGQVATHYHKKISLVSTNTLKWIYRFSQIVRMFGLPSLDKATYKSITTLTEYDNSKIIQELNYTFISVKDSIDYHINRYEKQNA